MRDWASAEAEIRKIASSEGFPTSAASQASAFTDRLRNEFAVPAEVAVGYWGNSIRFCWNDERVEVECFEDRHELYLLHKSIPDIRYFEFSPDGVISPELLAPLPRAGA